jgi:RNA polymerase sigma-70 factor (ECF subfamily)
MKDQRETSSVPDADLISRVKAGELEAFGQLYSRYLTNIYRYVRTRVSTDRDAEDLTEAVFLKAFESLGKYKQRGAPFSAFLYRVARNVIIDYYRTDKPVEVLEKAETIAARDVDAEKELIDLEQVKEIMKALGKLNERYQEVIRMRVLLDMSTEEIAAWMDMTPAAVRVLLHRALKRLRHELGIEDG